MDKLVGSVTLQYGDAEISFFCVNIQGQEDIARIWHRHSYYELHFATDHVPAYQFRDRSIALQPGELLIVPPDIPHSSRESSELTARRLTVVSMDIRRIDSKERFYDIFVSLLEQNTMTPLAFPDFSKAELDLFRQNALYSSFLGVCRLKSVAADLVCRLFSYLGKGSHVTVDGQREQESFVLIDNLINHPTITLADIAAATNYSKRHISRLIKQHYGMSLSAFRQKTGIQPDCKQKENEL